MKGTVGGRTPEQIVAGATDEVLLKSYAALTHRMDGALPEIRAAVRKQRDQVEDEILRRMKKGR